MKNVKVYVKNFGPVEEAELELAPLTILIGKNSVGKSILIYLLWTLFSTTPNIEEWGKLASELGANKLANKILEKVRKGLNPQNDFKELIELHLKLLPNALIRSLSETFKEVFGVELQELTRSGTKEAIISIKGPKASLELIIKGNELKVNRYIYDINLLNELKVQVLSPKKLKVLSKSEVLYDDYLKSLAELVGPVFRTLAYLVVEMFSFLFTSPEIVAILPDSRAGISRVLLKPYTRIKDILYPDEAFRDTYFMLTELLAKGKVNVSALNKLLNELGCSVESVFEGGVYTLYVNMWSGVKIPFFRAPSGVRESLIVALLLTTYPHPSIVFIEEPEAHLHPSAQKALAKLISKAINEYGKIVILSTHSDHLIYALNNLIALSSVSKKRKRKVSKLGYEESELLKPEKVRAYLMKASVKEKKAVVEPLEVSSKGISEEEFAKIVEELVEERAKILA